MRLFLVKVAARAHSRKSRVGVGDPFLAYLLVYIVLMIMALMATRAGSSNGFGSARGRDTKQPWSGVLGDVAF